MHVCHHFNFHVIVGPIQGLLSFLSLETFRPCSYSCCLLSGIDCQVLGKVGFNFPIALSLIHYVVSWVIMAILKSVSLLPAAPLSKATPLSTLVALSIVMAFSTGLANVSLKYNRCKILSLSHHTLSEITVQICLCLSTKETDYQQRKEGGGAMNWVVSLIETWILSVGFSSVGFYQMAKIAVTPTIVLAEFLVLERQVSFNKVFSFKPFLLHKGHCQWR